MTKRDQYQGFGSPKAALLGAAREALGAPALVLCGSYLGFGALIRSSDLPLIVGMLSTITGWALPGQIAMVELWAVGASLLSVGLAVALTNVRLLPMTLALMPHLRAPGTPRWRYYAASHLIAVTGWVQSMQRCPTLPVAERLPFLVGFSGFLWIATITATAVGYWLSGLVPASVSLGLVFLNPIYFMLVLSADIRERSRAWAMAFGAVAGPLAHLVSPEWGLLGAGLVAGTLAFVLDRWLTGHATRPDRGQGR